MEVEEVEGLVNHLKVTLQHSSPEKLFGDLRARSLSLSLSLCPISKSQFGNDNGAMCAALKSQRKTTPSM